MALLAEGNDVVMKSLGLRSEMATPKAMYLRPFLEMRLVAELLTVPKRVTVCWFCMVFALFCPVNRDTSQRARRSLLRNSVSDEVV